MNIQNFGRAGSRKLLTVLGTTLMVGFTTPPAMAVDLGGGWVFSGWARAYLSFNLEDVPETVEAAREAFLAEREKQRDAFMPLKQKERVKIWLDGLKARAAPKYT